MSIDRYIEEASDSFAVNLIDKPMRQFWLYFNGTFLETQVYRENVHIDNIEDQDIRLYLERTRPVFRQDTLIFYNKISCNKQGINQIILHSLFI